MPFFIAVLGTILSAASLFQITNDSISQPIVSVTLGYSLGHFGSYLAIYTVEAIPKKYVVAATNKLSQQFNKFFK